MNLWEIFKTSKGLPSDDCMARLFAQKTGKNSVQDITVSGYPCTLEKSKGKPVIDYRIYGNTVQDGTSSPENPVEVQSVGKLVTEGENSGKYEIPVVCRGKNLLNSKEFFSSAGISSAAEYKDMYVGDGIFTLSTTAPLTTEGLCNLFLLSGKVSQGANTSKNGVSFGQSRTVQAIDGYITIAYRRFYGVDITKYPVQLELGDTATEYRPYREPVRTSIMLDKMLETGEILKYPENVLVRADGTEKLVKLPEIPTFVGMTIVEVDTKIPPSDMEITYKARM